MPSHTLIGRALTHMRDCRAVATLTVPMWKSAFYWTLLCDDGVHLNFFVKDWLFLPDRPDIFVMGRSKNRFFLEPERSSQSVWLFASILPNYT